MEGAQIPWQFYILYFSKDIFQSLPFIFNLSLPLAFVLWQYQLKLTRHNIAALISGFSQWGYKKILIAVTAKVVIVNALCLFWLFPSLNYRLETELTPKVVQNTMAVLPEKTAFSLDSQHIFYFSEVSKNYGKDGRQFRDIQILNYDQTNQPFLIRAKSGYFINRESSLHLHDGYIQHLLEEQEYGNILKFNALDYKISANRYNVSHNSLSLRQLIADRTPLHRGHLFWKVYLSIMPLISLFVFGRQNITIKFSQSVNFSTALATAHFMILIILGLMIMKALESSTGDTGFIFVVFLVLLSFLFKELYRHANQ